MAGRDNREDVERFLRLAATDNGMTADDVAEQLVPLGFGGLEAPGGAHLCAFVKGRAGRDEVILPYLEAGFRNGEKCVAIVDSVSPDVVWGSLNLPDKTEIRESGQIEVNAADATYIRDGRFSYERMLEFWTGHAECQEGFPRMRGCGELHWVLEGLPGTEAFFYYESQVNHMSSAFPNILLLCLYDLDMVSGSAVIDALKTHPQVVVCGRLFQNPYYIDADELAKEWRPAAGI
jgi:DcmR-like sensory protein